MIKFSSIVNENSKDTFKVGLDIHGVIDAMPEFFSFLSESIIKNGGEVHIITGGEWTQKLENELRSYNIHWTHKFSVYDFLLNSGADNLGEIEFPDGTKQVKFDDVLWDRTKGDYCKDNNINLHLDDTLIYNNYFSTPFARLWGHSNKPKSSHKSVRHLD